MEECQRIESAQKKEDNEKRCKTIENHDVQLEAVVSEKRRTSAYDKDDYTNLRQRYLILRIREKAELAGGITLRRQHKGIMIDTNTIFALVSKPILTPTKFTEYHECM